MKVEIKEVKNNLDFRGQYKIILKNWPRDESPKITSSLFWGKEEVISKAASLKRHLKEAGFFVVEVG